VALTAARIAGVGLTSADADALAEFYLALGFERAGIEVRGGPAFGHLAQRPHAAARVVLLRLGEEWLEIATFAKRGRPYPRGGASNDPWFQHFAIVVANMQVAYERLTRLEGWSAITRPAPQRLPQSAGGITAFKFRDPEGHPLELLEFPKDRVPPLWSARARARHESRASMGRGEQSGVFLGVDHSAIVVANTERSVAFYERRLAFRHAGGSINRGVEQAHLDGLAEPEVEVTALASGGQPPHLELLCYRSPRVRAAPAAAPESADIAATRLLIEIDGPSRLRVALGVDDLAPMTSRCGALMHDPDGHALLLVPCD